MPRRASQLLALAVLGFLTTKLTTLLVNLPLFPTLRRPPPAESASRPEVALLIPIRDESARLAAALPGLLGSSAGQIIFLDDESTDDSVSVIRAAIAAAADGSAARVVSGRTRPDGWVGKTWACHQLSEATDAEILVFCDVDVLLAPGALQALVAEMQQQRAAVFSVFARQLVGGWGERLVVPLITDVVLCFLPFPILKAPVPAAATAHGALLAFRRSAYLQLGGFAAVRGELVEDVALARRTRLLGLQLGLALGGELAQVRMYRSYPEVITGLGRGLTRVAGDRRWLVAAGLGWHLLAYTAPVLLAARSRRWRLAALLGVTERVLVEAKTGGRDWPAALLVAGSPVAAVPVVRQALRRIQTWKGRQYAK